MPGCWLILTEAVNPDHEMDYGWWLIGQGLDAGPESSYIYHANLASPSERAMIAVMAALLLGGGKLLDEALSRLAPQLLDALPGWLNALRSWPLWAQALLILGLGLLAFGAVVPRLRKSACLDACWIQSAAEVEDRQ